LAEAAAFFKSRLLLRMLPPELFLSNLTGSSNKFGKSGKGGGDSEPALRMCPPDEPAGVIKVCGLLASALSIGKSDEAVSLEASLGGRL